MSNSEINLIFAYILPEAKAEPSTSGFNFANF